MKVSTIFLVQIPAYCQAFAPSSSHTRRTTIGYRLSPPLSPSSKSTYLSGWLDNFLPAPIENNDDSQRRKDYPEQYPATYELNDVSLESDTQLKEAEIVRPLLKQTMLERRPLQKVYDAEEDGWDPRTFHDKVDGKGAAVVIASYEDKNSGSTIKKIVGGYNPKGWSSNGGARPSVAAFLFYEKDQPRSFQKLQKCGGGGLACANDDPNSGISFGPDALVVPLQPQRPHFSSSKLGPYFERGPQNLSSLFESNGGGAQLVSLKVLTGVYEDGEEIPYSGAVMDMTSG
jgi:hypothetical protein